jgi:hypothetical protein
MREMAGMGVGVVSGVEMGAGMGDLERGRELWWASVAARGALAPAVLATPRGLPVMLCRDLQRQERGLRLCSEADRQCSSVAV